MEGDTPDRVPVWCLLSLEHIIRNGTPDGKIPRTIENFVLAECDLTRRYGFDGLVLLLPGTKKNTPVESMLGKMIQDIPCGDSDHVIENQDPDAWEWDRPAYDSDDFYSAHLAREVLGPDIHIGGWTPDGFSRAIQWFSTLDDAMVAIMQHPCRFKTLVQYFDRMSISWAEAQVRLGELESMHISSPYAGSSFISPATYRELVFPSVVGVVESLKDENVYTYLHTCGCISDRLEMMAESGIHGLECLDPPPLGDVTLEDAKKRVGDHIFLKGNIDSVNILLRGSDEVVEKTIVECLQAGMTGGGYILSTACSVAPEVPPERIQRMVELAERVGRYEEWTKE